MSRVQANVTDAKPLFLDGAYKRIQGTTIAINSVAIIAALIFVGWRAAVGAGIGTATAWVNLSWLHRGSEVIVESMLGSSGWDPQKRLFFFFVGRLAFMLMVGYVTFKSSFLAFCGFLAALGLAAVGLLGEAVYEAWVSRKQISR